MHSDVKHNVIATNLQHKKQQTHIEMQRNGFMKKPSKQSKDAKQQQSDFLSEISSLLTVKTLNTNGFSSTSVQY